MVKGASRKRREQARKASKTDKRTGGKSEQVVQENKRK
jgi:hypothetical protein